MPAVVVNPCVPRESRLVDGVLSRLGNDSFNGVHTYVSQTGANAAIPSDTDVPKLWAKATPADAAVSADMKDPLATGEGLRLAAAAVQGVWRQPENGEIETCCCCFGSGHGLCCWADCAC